MKISYGALMVGMVAAAAIGSMASAQDTQEVTVQGTRMVTTKIVGPSSSAVPVTDISISYGVSTAGLDLRSHAGVMELEKRVKDVAETACKELSTRYPTGTPSETDCAKAAVAKTMAKVNAG
jgi:UrcA family protein